MARRKLYYLADGQTVQGVVTPPVITADGAYPAASATQLTAYVDWEGGNGAFLVAGTVGGGTYTLQMQAPDGSTWLALGSNTTLTAAGTGGFSAPACRLRVNVSGSAGASIKSWVIGIPTNNLG